MYWCIGTTSFRVGNHLVKNKEMLNTLIEFWKTHKEWNDQTQPDLYDLARINGLVKGTASRKDKDARQITSGLVDVGLTDKRRNISEVGYSVLNAGEKTDDLFLLDEDNYIYLKQFLKIQMEEVRPFVALVFLLSKLEYLTYDEFTYLLPICKNAEDVKEVLEKIKLVRNKKLLFNDVIVGQIMKEDRINSAISTFSQIKKKPTIKDFVELDMNRKSTQYSEPLELVYNQLLYYINNREKVDDQFFLSLKEATKQLSQNLYKQYVRYFNLGIKISVETEDELKAYFDSLKIIRAKNIEEFNSEFGKIVHLCKWRSTLDDYADLNRRYFMLPNIVKFGNGKFELDILPKYVFHGIVDKLIDKPIIEDFEQYREFLQKDVSLKEIDDCLDVELSDIIPLIKKDFGLKDLNESNIKTFIDDKKLERMNSLIDEYFRPEQLVTLLEYITDRNDKALRGYAGIETDVTPSTLFEYFTAIAWYHVSGRKGNLLKFMNLKLDANLLPLTHAPGYFSDIVFKYDKTVDYEKHDLMLEVTLADSTGQRRMEMEPVSRHLVNYKNTTTRPSYALFVANELHKMVLSDFRSRRLYYYEEKGSVKQGLKIIPLSTKDLCVILQKGLDYSYLYRLFDEAYNDKICNDIEWYDKCVRGKIYAE